MRKVDIGKDITGKAAKTISFEKIVLLKLEARAKERGTDVSKLVNLLCRRVMMCDEAYHLEMMKYHHLKFQEHKYMKESIAGIEDPIKKELRMMNEGKMLE